MFNYEIIALKNYFGLINEDFISYLLTDISLMFDIYF